MDFDGNIGVDGSSSSALSLHDSVFMEFSFALYEYMDELMDTSVYSLETKIEKLNILLIPLPDTVELLDLIDIQNEAFLIDPSKIENFFNVLIKYKEIITDPDFPVSYIDILDEKTSGSPRWFLSTLASLLGANKCWTGAFAVIDTAAYIATGILTAPTGIGAIANWGAAAASYAYALSSIKSCR